MSRSLALVEGSGFSARFWETIAWSQQPELEAGARADTRAAEYCPGTAAALTGQSCAPDLWRSKG
eukprot:3463292-Rhodomonas_salina.2